MVKFTVAERLMVARGWDQGWGGLPTNGALENLRDDGRFYSLYIQLSNLIKLHITIV